MKRVDLEVGKSYYYNRSKEWTGFSGSGEKITVISTDCYEQPRSWGRSNPEPRKVNKGSGVLVEVSQPVYGSPGETRTYRKVVNLMHIRGEYEATSKQVEEIQEKQREQWRAEREQQDENEVQADAVIELAKQFDIRVRQNKYGTTTMIISAADLTRLIEAAKDNL